MIASSWIDGAPVLTGGDRHAVINPADGSVVAELALATPADVDLAIASARAALPGWSRATPAERSAVLFRLADLLEAHAADVIAEEVGQTGKPVRLATEFDLPGSIDNIAFFAGAARHLEGKATAEYSAAHTSSIRREAVGVVATITPWNYPLQMAVWKVIPALAAGCTVVIKPSEYAPLAVEYVIRGAQHVGFPEDVLLLATGDGEAGKALVDGADMIHFTGSTRTGRQIAARCGERLIPCSVELGGKDPMIVLADANIDRAANVAVEWSMRNSGQICMAIERVYVEEPVYDEFVAKVTAKVDKLRQGPPGGYGSVDVGAITFPAQMDVIENHVADAFDKGARIVAGGHRLPGPGRFFEPTVLVDVNHTMDCMTEETFGPLLPIMKVRNEQEAVRLDNDSPYGLGSSIFTRDIAKAERLARRLTAGNTWINDAIMSYLAQEAPFAGARQSGLGGRHGKQGIRKYCETHTILTSRFTLTREPTMFPNSARRSQIFERLMVVLFGHRSLRPSLRLGRPPRRRSHADPDTSAWQ